MTPAVVFSIVGIIAMPMWILMIFLPNWRVTKFLMNFKVIPLVLSLVYVCYIFKAMQMGEGTVDFGSFTSVMAMFTEENAVLAGWVHYLVFDLLVGIWMLSKNEELKMNQFIMAPCLLGTFMFGPVGFLLFMIIKTIKQVKR